MARLTRLRIVNLGHPQARMDDLTLNFLDAQQTATDSTIWLRNGGGKSSILNLFYALVQPNRTKFLGATAEQRKRTIEDYVLPNEPGAIIAEWALDASSPTLFGGAERYLTGMFCEIQDGIRTENGRVERSFFAMRVIPSEPMLTLEGVPLLGAGRAGRATRRTLSGFEAELRDLRRRFPHAEVSLTQKNGEWEQILDQAGLDPELFAYQLRMNAQEGGADQLFAFGETEDFINFFLELMVNPSEAEQVAKNIDTYRAELRDRTETYIPERELVHGVLECMSPLERVARERRLLADRMRRAWGTTTGALHAVTDAITKAERARSEELSQAEQATNAADDARTTSHAHAQLAATLTLWIARDALTRATDREAEAKRRSEAAQQTFRLWDAVVPLRRMRVADAEIATRQASILRLQQELKPYLDGVQAAGTAYGAALLARAQRADGDAQRVQGQQRDHRRDAEDRRSDARSAGEEAAQAETEARTARENAERAQRELDLLLKQGALQPNEQPVNAVRRHAGDMEAHRCDLQDQKASAASREEQLRAARAEETSAKTRFVQHQTELRQARSLLAAAEAAARAILTSRYLARVLSSERPEESQLTGRTVVDARGLARACLDAIVAAQLDRAVDQRAVTALEATELLPPSRDVERALVVLKGRLANAWSGWEHLSKNVHPDRLDRVVAAAPALAMGIVVRDGDVATAAEHLRATIAHGDLALEEPLSIVPGSLVASLNEAAASTRTAVFDPGAIEPSIVLAPTDLAIVRRDVGQRALVRRREAIERHDELIDTNQHDQREFETLAASIDAFRHTYPTGWMSAQVASIDDLAHRTGEADRDVTEWGGRVQLLTEEQARGEQRQQELVNALRRSEQGHMALQGFVMRHPEGVSKYSAQAAQNTEHARVLRRTQDEALTAASVAEKTAQELEPAIVSLGVDAKADRASADRIPYRSPEALVPQAGDVLSLKNDFDALLADYEGRTNMGAETALLTRAREDRAAAERDFNRVKGVTVADAETALASLADPSEAEVRRDAAQEQFAQLSGALSRPAVDRTNAQTGFDAAKEVANKIKASHVPSIVPASVDAAALDRDEALRVKEEQERSATEFAELATNATKNAEVFRIQTGVMRQIESRLTDIVTQRDDIKNALVDGDIPEIMPVIAVTAQGMATEGVVDQWNTIADTCSRDVHEIGTTQVTLNETLVAVHGEIKRWLDAEQFAELRVPLVVNLRQWEAEQFEVQYDLTTEDLRLRRQTLDAKIGEIDQDRSVLINQARTAAFAGMILLQQLGRQSKVPETVAGIGGRDFLQVKVNVPSELTEQRERLGVMIDEMSSGKGAIPDGIKFIQQAVRRLAGDITVKVLFPDPDVPTKYVPITDLAKLSGGERLTCATLMYCALARMRARSRGKLEQPSGVLLCDNPVGKASRPKFLELQREVARKMGIQLLYFTGVNDIEALRMLPGCIRLRNNRLDRATGQRLVEFDAPAQENGARTGHSESTTIQGARIMRHEVAAIPQSTAVADDATAPRPLTPTASR